MPLSSSTESVFNFDAVEQGTSDIQAKAKKGYLLVWRSLDGSATTPSNKDFDLHARAFNNLGQAVGGDIKFTLPSTDIQSDPIVAPLSGGRSVVTWVSRSIDANGFDYNVFGRIVDKFGNPIGNQFKVNSTEDVFFVTNSLGTTYSNEQSLPRVTTLTSGNFVVTWYSVEQATQSAEVRARIFDSNGKPKGKDFLVNSKTADVQFVPDITALSNGGFAVSWTTRLDANNRTDIGMRLFDKNGKPKGAEFLANDGVAGSQGSSIIRQLDDGKIVVAWSSSPDGNAPDVKARMFSSTGTPLTSEFFVNESEKIKGSQKGVEIVDLKDGRFIALWMSADQLPDGRDGQSDILGRIFTKFGAAATPEFIVNQTTQNDQYDPHATLLSNGQVAVSFTSDDSATDTNVHTTILNPNSYTGTDAAETYLGGILNDTMFLGAGNDTGIGKKGNDFIDGGDGDDFLSGGKGKDKIMGGAGADTIATGADLDKIMYASPFEGGDTILDFKAGDKLVFDANTFNLGAAGKLPKAEFRYGTAAADADDRFIFTKATGQLWFDSDGNGEAGQVLIATLTNGHVLTADEIMVNFLAV